MFGELVVSSICLFESSPLFREMIQFDEHVFLDGLAQTPTRKNILDVFLTRSPETRNLTAKTRLLKICQGWELSHVLLV